MVHSGLTVVSDPGYLRRVVQNLLSNAIRYTEKGRVLAGVRRVGDFARIEVWDSGCGIAEQDQQTIFQEFKQLGSGAANSGLGLGLAIVERPAKALATRWSFGHGREQEAVFPLWCQCLQPPPRC